jgi:hypothetical protein
MSPGHELIARILPSDQELEAGSRSNLAHADNWGVVDARVGVAMGLGNGGFFWRRPSPRALPQTGSNRD